MNKNKILTTIYKLIESNLYPVSLYARQIAGTLILFIIARYLPVYDYGLFSSYRTIAVFILVFANMGFESYILVSSQNNAKKVKLKIALFMLNAFSLLLLTSIILPFTNLEKKLIFFLVLFRTFFDGTFFALILPYFQASRKLKVISIINIIYAICVSIIALISYIFNLSLIHFLLMNILLGLINFIQCSFLVKVSYLQALKHITKFFKYIDKSIISYMLVNIFFILYTQIPGLYISTFVDKDNAALFFSAYTIANIVMLLISAQTQKIMPEFIDANVQQGKKILKDESMKMFIATFVLFLFFVSLGKYLLKLLYFKDFYQGAYSILLILSLGNISFAIGKIYVTYIVSKGYSYLISRMQLESIIISIITILLLNKYNIYAAAIAYFSSATYIGIRYTLKTKQLLKEQI